MVDENDTCSCPESNTAEVELTEERRRTIEATLPADIDRERLRSELQRIA